MLGWDSEIALTRVCWGAVLSFLSRVPAPLSHWVSAFLLIVQIMHTLEPIASSPGLQ